MTFNITLGTNFYGGVRSDTKRKNNKTLIDALTAPLPTQKRQNSLQTLIKEKFKLLSGETRNQQLQELARTQQEISPAEQRMNRTFMIASANVGIAAMSLLYPPFVLLIIPGLIYCSIPLYQLAYKAVFKEHRVSSYLIDSLFVTGMLLGGFFQIGTLGAWFFIAGRKLLLKTEDNSKKNLMNLFQSQPRFIWVRVNGVEVEIPFETLQTGDMIVVGAGQVIPADGMITEGFASIDQHTLTGESQPVEKSVGDPVFASTVVLAGKIFIETQKTGEETVAMQIGKVLKHTADFKSLMQSRGEAIADQMVLPTLGISTLIFPFWGLSSALAVLSNTFGYKMRLFAPASMLSFLNLASQQGILIKDGRSLDLLGRINTVVFDKTGTLTLEEPTVHRVHVFAESSEEDILRYAAAAEYGQTHPIARAILQAARERTIQWPTFDHAKYEVGYGIQVTLAEQVIHVGSERFMTIEGIPLSSAIGIVQNGCHEQGHSLVMVALNQAVIGAIELHATLRPEVKQITKSLRQRGMAIYIISGDHEEPTKQLSQMLGVDHYFANTLPQNKAALVAQLQAEGKSICFVGDGINDSIALKKANVSVSLSGATTMATDTAQIVLMDGSLNKLGQLFDIGQEFEKNMRSNLWLSIIPSTACIAGILFFHWGIFAGTLLSGGALFIGIGNTILPLFKGQIVDRTHSKIGI